MFTPICAIGNKALLDKLSRAGLEDQLRAKTEEHINDRAYLDRQKVPSDVYRFEN